METKNRLKTSTSKNSNDSSKMLRAGKGFLGFVLTLIGLFLCDLIVSILIEGIGVEATVRLLAVLLFLFIWMKVRRK